MSESQVPSDLSSEVVKVLTKATLALVLFSDASRVGLHPLPPGSAQARQDESPAGAPSSAWR